MDIPQAEKFDNDIETSTSEAKTVSNIKSSKTKNVIKSGDATREKIREILQEAFFRVSRETDGAIMDKAKACDPIRDSKNPDFQRKVLLKELALKRLIDIRREDIASNRRKKENEKIKRKALFECEHGQKPKATTDQSVCEKWRKRETTFYQMQTPSVDEPMTTYVTRV
ncbi:transcription elongation factor TFIIS-like [Neltuma alba]|uniref:transcription elongation factor TFIIS-like n=1 Tax=Neltuma alba TaxID=207710 RepID=UPI0010A349C0|nr:transcription elongation factor TFIIS-like [Prosopis alba]